MGAIRDHIKQLVIRLLPIYQYLFVKSLRYKKQINVVFYASSLAMWRYQHLYEEMVKHPRFKTSIVLIPMINYSIKQQKKDVDTLKSFFSLRNIENSKTRRKPTMQVG
jgi:hypothetical protein